MSSLPMGDPTAGMRLADRFDLLWGLPVHPIAVAFAVVLLPLSSLLLVAIVLIPKLQRVLGWFVMILLTASVGIAYLAQESGAALAARLGRPQEHADLAILVLWFTAAQLVAGFVWFLAVRIRQRRAKRRSAADPMPRPPSMDPAGGATGGVDLLTGRPFGAPDPNSTPTVATPTSAASPATIVLGMFAVLVAALNLFLNWQVAESGMRATWEGRLAAPTQTPSATPSQSSPSVASPSVVSPSVVSPSVISPSVISPSEISPSEISPSPGLTSPVAPRAGAPTASSSVTAPLPTESPTTESLSPQSGPDEFADTLYTRGDVAAHSRAESCWIIVETRVYDLTGWLPVHPDSAATFEELCGTDTTGVITPQAWASLISPAQLAKLQIGVLE